MDMGDDFATLTMLNSESRAIGSVGTGCQISSVLAVESMLVFEIAEPMSGR